MKWKTSQKLSISGAYIQLTGRKCLVLVLCIICILTMFVKLLINTQCMKHEL